jgi:hypothetical protein
MIERWHIGLGVIGISLLGLNILAFTTNPSLGVILFLGLVVLAFTTLTMAQQRTIDRLNKTLAESNRTILNRPGKLAHTLISLVGLNTSKVVAERWELPTPPSLYAQFQVVRGPNQGETIGMTKPIWSFGRELGAGVDYVFRRQNISALHCTLTYDRATHAFLIEDKGSGNGTFINNVRLHPGKAHALYGENEIRLAQADPIILRFIPIITPPAPDSTIPHPARIKPTIHPSRSEVYSGLIHDPGTDSIGDTSEDATELYRSNQKRHPQDPLDDDLTQIFRDDQN